MMPPDHLILCHPLLFQPWSFPASGSFPMSWLFALGGQRIGASASVSVSVLLMIIYGWFPLGLTHLISFLSKGLSRVFSSTLFEGINSLVLSLLYGPALTSVHDYWKNCSFDYTDRKMMSLLFNTLSRFVIAFIPRSKCLLISWLQSPSAVILQPKNFKLDPKFIFESLLLVWSFLNEEKPTMKPQS